MAQKTAWTGAVLTESDINTYLMHEGGAWTSWTPVVTQSTTPTITNTRSRWARASRLITVSFNVVVASGTGTAANAILMTIPVTAASSGIGTGVGELLDSSTALRYPCQIILASTTAVQFTTMSSAGAADNRLGVLSFTAALAVSDQLQGTFTYESAT